MRRPGLVLLVVWCVSAAAFAAGGGSSKAGALAKEADRLYKENKYKEAAETLKEAFDADGTPLYLYNIARAYDQAAELDLAMDYYRKYVGLPSDQSQPDLVKKANLAMDRLRTLLAKSEADKKVRDAEKQKLEDDAKKAEARADAEAAEARKQRREFEAKEKARREEQEKKVNSRKLIAYVTGGVGVASLGSSLVLAISSAANKDAFRKAQTLADKQRLEAETRGTAAATDITLVLGIAAGVATVLVWPKDGAEPAGGVNVVVAPVSGGAMASFGMRF